MENKKDIEKSIREIMNNLSPEQITELKEGYKNVMGSFLSKEIEKLATLENEKQRLENEKSTLDRQDWNAKSLIDNNIRSVENKILLQKNIVKCFENGGTKVNVKDEDGFEYENIPDFRAVSVTEFNFDETNVNLLAVPAYVPFIYEQSFKRNHYVFDSIRITEDSYLISMNRYDSRDKKNNTFVIVTLDQLVLIVDYYICKQKAKNIQAAKEANERSRQHYFNLSEQERRRYMFQKGVYRGLSVAEKKKISEEEFEKLDLEGREKYYLPIKKHGVERVMSKLDDSRMNSSFHKMYQDFIDKEKSLVDKYGNPSERGAYANPVVWRYWTDFIEMVGYKLKDIRIQREDYSDTYKQALETSFGESNVDPVLKDQYGILVKRQNGDKINPVEIQLIKESWIEIQSLYGNLKAEALKHNLKISHSGQKLMFAMKALGVYISQMGTIGVSNKLGEIDFKSTFAHEVAHFIDNFIGELNGKRWATDNYESLAGKIAFTFRNSMNKNKKDQTDYINATKECFARAFQQYFITTKFGEDVKTMNVDNKISTNGIEVTRHPNFVNKFTFESDIKPMIEQFLSENLDVFETTIDLDGTNDLAPITEEENKVVDEVKTEKPEENIQELIEGLEVLKDSMEESEQKELEEVIEGLKLLI